MRKIAMRLLSRFHMALWWNKMVFLLFLVPLFVNWLPDMDILQLHSSDPDLTKPWDGKISFEDIAEDGKTIHLIRC